MASSSIKCKTIYSFVAWGCLIFFISPPASANGDPYLNIELRLDEVWIPAHGVVTGKLLFLNETQETHRFGGVMTIDSHLDEYGGYRRQQEKLVTYQGAQGLMRGLLIEQEPNPALIEKAKHYRQLAHQVGVGVDCCQNGELPTKGGRSRKVQGLQRILLLTPAFTGTPGSSRF